MLIKMIMSKSLIFINDLFSPAALDALVGHSWMTDKIRKIKQIFTVNGKVRMK